MTGPTGGSRTRPPFDGSVSDPVLTDPGNWITGAPTSSALKYSKPTVTSPVTIDLNATSTRVFTSSTYQNKHLIVIPKPTIDTAATLIFQNALSVTIIGGHFRPGSRSSYPGGGPGAGTFTFQGCGQVYMEGVVIDNVNIYDDGGDAVFCSAKTASTTFTAQNCHFFNVRGTQEPASAHGDVFQNASTNQGKHGPARFYNCTFTCNYQGLFLDPQATGTTPGGQTRVELERVNIRGTASRAAGTRLIFIVFSESRYATDGYPMTMNDVWVKGNSNEDISGCIWPHNSAGNQNQFPTTKCHAVISTVGGVQQATYPGMNDTGKVVSGVIKYGDPPGGDFAPLNSVGLNYTGGGGVSGAASVASDGTITLTGIGTTPAYARQAITTIVGRKYRMSMNVSGVEIGRTVGTTNGGDNVSAYSTGPIGASSLEFTATTTTTWINLQRVGVGTATIKDFAIDLLPENPVEPTPDPDPAPVTSITSWTFTKTGEAAGSMTGVTSSGFTIVSPGPTNTLVRTGVDTLTVGKNYRVTFTVSDYRLEMSAGTSTGGQQYKTVANYDAGATYTFEFVATATTFRIQFQQDLVGNPRVSGLKLEEISASNPGTVTNFATVRGYGNNLATNPGGIGQPYYFVNRWDMANEQGTLVHALGAGNRLIIFEVGGIFTHTGQLGIKAGANFVSIAGETAPSPGVLLQGATSATDNVFGIRGSNWHISHVAFHRGYSGTDTSLNNGDVITMNTSGRQLRYGWFDHCLTAWGQDEAFQSYHALSTTDDAQYMSFTNCIFTDPLNYPPNAGNYMPNQASKSTQYPNGAPHGYNLFLAEKSQFMDAQNNIIANGLQRNPRIGGRTKTIIANNVLLNWGRGGITLEAQDNPGQPLDTTIIGNIGIGGPDRGTFPNMITQWAYPLPAASKVYLEGNSVITTYAANPCSAAFGYQGGNTTGHSLVTTRPLTLPGLVAMDQATLLEQIELNAGPRPKDRRVPTALRCIDQLKKRGQNAKIIDHESQGGGKTTAAQFPNASRPIQGTALAPPADHTNKEAVWNWLKSFKTAVQYDPPA
mgnify:FL=1